MVRNYQFFPLRYFLRLAVMRLVIVFIATTIVSFLSLLEALKRVVVLGSTGYIGRNVVKELMRRGVPTCSIVRSLEISEKTKKYLEGSQITVANILSYDSIKEAIKEFRPDSVVCCLASRSGVKRDAWSVDYEGGLNSLKALSECWNEASPLPHFVLLSAYCVGKPELQFQLAKLELEAAIRADCKVTHSIVRPTAFFKSVDGQLETARKGNPIIFFGDGSCSANAISESDLAAFLCDSALVGS